MTGSNDLDDILDGPTVPPDQSDSTDSWSILDQPTVKPGETPADLRDSELPEDIVREQRGIVFEPGTVIADRFEIIERFGSGGVGADYKVTDRLMPGEVKALRVMLSSLTHSEKMREQSRLEKTDAFSLV